MPLKRLNFTTTSFVDLHVLILFFLYPCRETCPKEVQACCDVTTCKFREGAECASGPCCDIQTVYGDPTCKLKASGTVCRDVGNSCDLPEYCDGQSEWCPADVFKTDGEACYTKEGYRVSWSYQFNLHIVWLLKKRWRSGEQLCYFRIIAP